LTEQGFIKKWTRRFSALAPFVPAILAYRMRFWANRVAYAFKRAKPGFSLLIITYNRSAFLKRTIEAVVNSTSADFEIIIADNNSTDQTAEVISEMRNKYPGKIRHLKLKRNYGTNAYALAFLQSSFGFVVDMDDDILAIQNGWDKAVMKAFNDFPDLGFLSLNVIQDNYTNGSKPGMEEYSVVTNGNTTIQIGPAGGWFAVTRRDVYYKAGGFVFLPNKAFRMEDGQFSGKIRRMGLKSGILSDTFVYHASGPKWNARGNYHKVWKEKYSVDYKNAVNAVDEMTESELPDFDVPQNAINKLMAERK
jgi:glycosyltransferase involved in cell wall biosynthesis